MSPRMPKLGGMNLRRDFTHFRQALLVAAALAAFAAPAAAERSLFAMDTGTRDAKTKTYAEQVEAQKVVVAHSYGPNDCTPLRWKGALRGVSQGAAKLPWSVWLCGGGLLSSKTFLEQVRLPCLPARCPSSPFARPRTSTHPLLPGRRSFTAAARR